MTLHQIVKKLIGPIEPAGDASIDDKRLANLKVQITLIEDLVRDVSDVRQGIERQEHSIKKAARVAHEFLDELVKTY